MIIVPVKDGENIERALKKFKRKFEKTGVIKELRARQQYDKPSVLKRLKIKRAIYVQKLREEKKKKNRIFIWWIEIISVNSLPETDDKLFDMVRRFLEYIKLERGYSPNTVTSYGDDLEGFEKFFTELEGGVTWQTVDSDVVRMWMEKLMESGYTASSVNRKLSALRSFYKFALKRNLLSKDPVHMLTGPKKHKPLPVYVE